MSWFNIVHTLSSLNKGIEIGGPTQLFRSNHYFPLYGKIKNIDGVNLKDFNYWQEEFNDKYIDTYNGVLGDQYFVDLTEDRLPDNLIYDFVISSNVIEHVANPIKLIKKLDNNLSKNSYMLMLLPYYKATFDRKRNITTIQHLIEDYINNIREDDETHTDDAVLNFDVTWGGDYQSYVKNSKENYKYRQIHHHCFDMDNAAEMIKYCEYDVIYNYIYSNNIVLFAKKTNQI